MKVILKRTWFGPGGVRYRPSSERNPTNLPDGWKDKLPKDAHVLSFDSDAKSQVEEQPEEAAAGKPDPQAPKKPVVVPAKSAKPNASPAPKKSG